LYEEIRVVVKRGWLPGVIVVVVVVVVVSLVSSRVTLACALRTEFVRSL
jgi:plastocyanin domain-containing protein